VRPIAELKKIRSNILCSASEEPKHDAYHNADNQACHDWQVDSDAWAFDYYIAWQSAQSGSRGNPPNDADNHKDDSAQNEDFWH
jgi:hypothetical protein